jgi:hypothetical protein
LLRDRFPVRHKHADPPNVLLSARRERPCGSRTAERGYELPSSNADCHLPRARCHRDRISRLKMEVCGRPARRLLGVLLPRLGQRGAAEDDPTRHFGTANCRSAKGSFNHLVGTAKSGNGMLRPKAFSILRLITSSNLVGCWIGSSLTFVPPRGRYCSPSRCT